MSRLLINPFLLGLLGACSGGFKGGDTSDTGPSKVDGGDGGGDGGDGTDDTGGGSGSDGSDGGGDSLSASVSWGGSSLTLGVSGGPGALWFGLAETGSSEDPWTGEDCVYGYADFFYCHDAGDGGDTTLSYGGDPTNLNEGTTVFNESYEGSVAYFLESDSSFGGSGECWIWGTGDSYYSGLGCDSL